MKVILTVTGGPHQGRDFAFEDHDTFLVGRSPDAHFRLSLKDRYFSRAHFLVEVNPPLCRLMDMASTNGTFVNDRRVEVVDLHDGDVIRGGETTIRVAVEEGQQEGAESAAADDESDYPWVPDPAEPGLSPESIETVESPAAPRRSPPSGNTEEAPGGDGTGGLPRVPRHQIERELGRGGMGVVYLARCERDGQNVALKTILPANGGSSDVVARFLREAGLLRRLEHPNIVRFREVGQADGRFYFAMEYVQGGNAHDLRKSEGLLATPRAVDLVCQALDALDYAHGLGFVHRDIKPRNLLVRTILDRDIVKLADFGLARIYLDSPLSGLTLTGEVSGTFGFMPPEQVIDFRRARPSADLYAVGATLYYLLTGHRPYNFPPGVQHQIVMLLNEDPVPIRERRPDLEPDLAGAIDRSLAREPAARFPDAKAMRQTLLPFARPR